MIVADLLTLAKKVDNYEIYTGVADVYWLTTTNFRAVVPAGKRWFLFGGNCDRENSSTFTAYVKNSGDNILLTLAYSAATTGHSAFPVAAYAGSHVFPYPLDADDYVDLIFGTAQSTAAYCSILVLEVDI